MTCMQCLSRFSCSGALVKMYQEEAEKCPYLKNKADFVEVVYCKDCEYNENGVCIHPDNITHSYDSDDNVYDYYISVWSGHFCSYGKRK